MSERAELLALLAAAAAQYPNLRIGQIVSNAASMGGYEADPFYVPDEKLIVGLRELLTPHGEEQG